VGSLGENIERLRDARGLSQAAFGDLMRMRQPSVAKLERGTNPELRTLFKIAKVLACSIEDLVTGVDEDYDRSRTSTDEFDIARVRTGKAGDPKTPVQVVLRELAPHEHPSLVSARDELEHIRARLSAPLIDLAAFVNSLAGGQAAMDRRPAPGRARRPRKNRRRPDRESRKKAPPR
jgi:transcriptional regulator with XRE-family HTH domain